MQREFGGIFHRRGALVVQFGFELFGDRLWGNAFARACFGDGSAALAAEINSVGLEDAGTPRTFGD
jgi:hypothetical protein